MENKCLDCARLERDLLRCRYLITRAAVHRLGLRDLESIAHNRPAFVAECHRVFKRAQAVLVGNILELERQISALRECRNTGSQYAELNHWVRILEAFYDSFIWLASENDRSNVSKIYKGPKYGSLDSQNIDSVLELARHYNDAPQSFAVPLDFCRFSCVSDLLLIEDDAEVRKISFIEVKEGKANVAFLEAKEAGSQEAYFRFFEEYGEKGIKQAERCFRQAKVLADKTATFAAAPGVYHGEGEVRFLVQPKTEYQYYASLVEDLCKKARLGETLSKRLTAV